VYGSPFSDASTSDDRINIQIRIDVLGSRAMMMVMWVVLVMMIGAGGA
jgi:hypothetical protein